jgi:hypothetical protein
MLDQGFADPAAAIADELKRAGIAFTRSQDGALKLQ